MNRHNVWNKNISFEPFPVRTVLKANEFLLGLAKNCLLYNKEMERYKKTREFKKLVQKSEKSFQYLTEKTGLLINSLEKMHHLYDILYIENLKGKT